MGEYVIETQDLVKVYKDRSGVVKALDGVSLKVPKAVLFGLFGPNGSGKTTLISILVGLQLPTSGSAQVLGFDCVRESIEVRKRVGLLPENYGFYESMTAYENLEYLGKLDGIPVQELKRRIPEVLELVGLKEWINSKVKSFSRGMTQRLALAQALLKDPEILLLDEPTLGLDPQGSTMFRKLMEEFVKSGKSVLISTHLLHELGYICTQAAFLRKGKLVAQGSIEELAKVYSKEKGYSYELLVAEDVELLVKELMKLEGVIHVSFENDKVRVRASEDISDELASLVGKFRVKAMVPISPTWDELYQFYQGGGWE
ncbi:MAG: ABC transporter ATP-binding protein [Thermofilaceae archaeon]|nr:ABC transporter ATP-binding protein [Thermofilaceae archaeon]MCX8180251.1 ABC transporter ATP-binding protein [Thermofilaceae archaeon]MDW8004029.1 ABC transporter ATP-binding protein [Thermofilaceae archaeon]